MKEKTAEDITFGVVMVAIAITIMSLCGCAGTKYANTSNTHELNQQGEAINGLKQHIDQENKEAVGFFNQIFWRWQRMSRLQGARNNAEGTANVPASDDLLPVAIMKLYEQGATIGNIFGVLDAVGGTVFGSYWKEILALITMVTGVAIQEYRVKKNKDVAVANTQAIEAYGSQNPEADGALKNYQRYYLAKNAGTDKLIQNAAASVRADMSVNVPTTSEGS